ncbi:DnaJ domain-containing protein [Haliangium sp.]|uniref:DnaJ domain-containing protein n=1 Tax=Haliangium sp. TaxID=2663208 RepID=UPI003D0B91DE
MSPAPTGPARSGSEAEGERVLDRGALAPLLYRLGRTQASGTLELFPPLCSPTRLRVVRGVLATGELDPLGRVAARRLAGIASMQRVRWRLLDDDGGPREPVGREPAGRESAGEPGLCLARWSRTHIESQLDAARARAVVTELAGAPLALVATTAPPALMCDDIDRRILAALASPRPLHELWHMARTSRFRLLSFLYFLRSVGALRVLERPAGRRAATSPGPAPAPTECDRIDEAQRAAEQLLGVPRGASRDALRRAFRRRVRALHPDLHPHASPDQRRHLERALASVSDAYERLLELSDRARGLPRKL